ncbi:MAG: hypothetical protein IIY81_00465 [Lachnospiraceae bacterium]|nr:hypothetical protein [Lachnospiraceae bacterium]
MGATKKARSIISEEDKMELYRNQSKYERYVSKKKTVYSFLFLIGAILNIVVTFVIPLFEYDYTRKPNSKLGIKALSIKGEYTHFYLFQKFFDGGLGDRTMLKNTYIFCLGVLVVLEVILVVGGLINVTSKRSVTATDFLSKVFNYGMMEVYATLFWVFLVAAMVCGKVDVDSGMTNAIGFWICFASSAIMTCTAIPLSDK